MKTNEAKPPVLVWEELSRDCGVVTDRARIDGGHLYRAMFHSGVSMVFVPAPMVPRVEDESAKTGM